MTAVFSQFVGTIPSFYDSGLGPVLFEDFADDLVRRCAALDPQAVLELAAGTGIVSRRLAEAIAPRARLVVTDLNAPMLGIARQKLADRPEIEFAEVDAQALPYADATFDLVVCQFGVMFFPDRRAAYREAARVLRPGGQYLFSTWGPWSVNPFAAGVQGVVEAHFPADPPGFYKVPFSCGDPDAVLRDLEAAGWRGTEYQTLRQTRVVADPAGFATALVHGNPLIAEIRQRGHVDPEVVVADVLAALVGRFGTAPMEIPLQTMVFTCRKP
jgi:SAM-dependent methyltransferase